MKQLQKRITLIAFMLFVTLGFSQSLKSGGIHLPKQAIGEWYSNSGTGEYNGVLIHQDFIEYGYRAFMYQDIKKIDDVTYGFVSKDAFGNSINGELQVINKDSIQLKRGNMPKLIYASREAPEDSKRTLFTEVLEVIKKKWYTTDGNNSLEFDVTNGQFVFRGENYNIEEIVNFKSNGNNEYRFIVKSNETYWMFYFKNWSEHYLQVGFNGKMGDLYKSNKDYPDYRIADVPAYITSIMPKALRGNWLKTDGSNLWGLGFYYNYAVVDKAIWNYTSVKQKGKWTVITLENNGQEKTIFAKPNKDNTVSFGANKKQLIAYGLNQTNHPNFKTITTETNIFEGFLKNGIATYSGIIRNYNKAQGHTGTAYVNNVFTGEQNSYLIEIKEDGSFTVCFPCYHLQQVYVKLPESYNTVYVEPGKQTWQLINSDKRGEGFFAGDLAQLNTDCSSLDFLVFDREYYNLTKRIASLEPQDYKAECFKLQQKQLAQLDSVSKTRYLSEEAYRLMALNLEYRGYEYALSYDMYKRTPYKEKANVDKDYIDFITPEVLNNKTAILTSSYTSFINRLRFLSFLREGISVRHPDVLELSELLEQQKVNVTAEEEELIALHKTFKKENAAILRKQNDFNNKYREVQLGIGNKVGAIYQKLTEEDRKQILDNGSIDLEKIENIAKVKNINIAFTNDELEYHKVSKNLLSEEERERLKSFRSEALNKRDNAFKTKYKTFVDKYVTNEIRKQSLEKIHENLGDNFSADIIVAQEVLGSLSRYFVPFKDEELTAFEGLVESPFVASAFKIENDRLKAKIEANKSKTGFANNAIPETEADKVFEAIMSKYKGKVVFVDFWATWCGPCRSGMKRMKPLKEELKDKDIVFVYITNPSSPEQTYNNMIPDIKGEHYRVSKDEWNHLSSRFNITGIPHYLLVDKEGNIVKDNTGDLRTPESVKHLFETYL
ncbi:redoxin family protein [Aestuariivivens insulae]|uniref:redoxin family protein n=1 Tax=Aestuariivivens insulae TaxID=1621988 RepID=UPI001F5AA4D7|nr:redoxin family protein [Aestuariivivens insulae]